MRRLYHILTVLVLISVKISESSRILIIQTSVTKSHLFPIQVLAQSLAEERKHEVTLMSLFPINRKIENLREFAIPYDEDDKEFMYQLTLNKPFGGFLETMKKVGKIPAKLGNGTLQMDDMKNLMRNEKFDLLIIGYFMNVHLLGLGDHFKCPTVIFSPSVLFSSLYRITGNPFSLSAVNHYLLQSHNHGFIDRLKNFLIYGFDIFLISGFFEYYNEEVYNYNFPASKYRSLRESERNVSLVLLNSHFSSNFPQPLLPNVIEVGGLQTNSALSELPEDIKQFLDTASHGAILFSLGSKVDISTTYNETIEGILKVFSKLDQKVIIKWGTQLLRNKPKNIFLSGWLPQNDILAHPNLKVFISHCGLNSIVEAKFHGIPIIGSPLYSDQFRNCWKVEKEGWGKVVDLKTIKENELVDVIQEIMRNSSYSSTAKQLSALQSDRPIDARSLATYWIEYVIRHHGAPHLHYPAADMNILQSNSIDVIGFMILVCFVIYKIFAVTMGSILRICKRFKKRIESKKKLN